MSNNGEFLIDLRDVSCRRGEATITGVSLSFAPTSFHLLRGESASLLLRVTTLLEPPDDGVVTIAGESVRELDECTRTTIRSRAFGFVFDAPFLLPELSVAENIAMPLFKVLDLDAVEARERTEAMLRFARLEPLATTRAGDLSLFDQQCVALARAVAHQPAMLALDHADASLSSDESAELLRLARRVRSELGIGVLALCSHLVEARAEEHVLNVTGGCVREEAGAATVAREQAS
jgi:ABC-type lipoprotein export system ATPase subunit